METKQRELTTWELLAVEDLKGWKKKNMLIFQKLVQQNIAS